MSKRSFLSALWASTMGFCLMACLRPAAMGQAPSAKPAPAAQGVLPVYIEEFFLSEAVRSEEHGELQLTLDGMAFSGRGSAADGKSAGLDIEYGITRRLQFGMEVPYGIQSTATSELPVSWSTLNASLLYQFIRGNHPFALSGAIGVNLPLTSRGSVSYEPEVMAAKGFGKLQIHASFIPELSDDEKSFEYNVASLRPVAHHLIPTLEFNGRRNSGVNSFYVTPGIYKHLPHRLEMGVGVPAGIGSASSPVGVVFKMTWEIGGDDDD
ncbi:MAG: hypothetical protein ABSC77_13865 [Terracidiphilus sp.]|jgi:hypothetical protein